MKINMNVIKASHEAGVKRLVCALSTCIFPDCTVGEMHEDMLHRGAPHPSNQGYAYAKRMCALQCELYRKQKGSDFCCVIPTNLYGPYDSYGPDKSHVVAGLIERCSRLKAGEPLVVWGSGKPLRQFCFTMDLCKLMLWVLFRPQKSELIALVPQEEHSILGLSRLIASEFGVKNIEFDTTKADGQHRKYMSPETLRQNLQPNTFEFCPLEEGLKPTIEWFN